MQNLKTAIRLIAVYLGLSPSVALKVDLVAGREGHPPTRSRLTRWTAVLALVIASAASRGTAQETGTVNIAGTFTSDTGEHTWLVTLYGTTHTHRQEWSTYWYYFTEVQATSFDLRFTGPDADDLNRIASEQFVGGKASLQLRNVYDFGYNLSTMVLSVSSPDESTTFWAGNWQTFSSGLFPWDAYGYPTVTPEPFPFWSEETYISWYGDFYDPLEPDVYRSPNAEIWGSLGSDDPPPPPTLGIGDASVLEGDRGSSNLRFTVSRSGSGPEAVSVSYRTVDGTARATSDYDAASGTLTFPMGISRLTITIAVKGDHRREPNETFTVQLFNAVGATVVDAIATGTILNDD